MIKKTTLLLYLIICTQLASCSTVKDYLISATPMFFKLAPPLPITPVLEYDFIQPRYSELPLDTASMLNEPANRQDHLTYYSASGHECYTLSLSPFRSVCNINGQWVALAPVLNN